MKKKVFSIFRSFATTKLEAKRFCLLTVLTTIFVGGVFAQADKLEFIPDNRNKPTAYSVKAASTSISGSVEIPNTKDGIKIITIANNGFQNCKGITSVTIPSNLTSIGNNAFNGCTALTKVTVGANVSSIGTGAFRGCDSLTSVNIPDRVTTIANGMFSGCKSLTSINIPDNVTTIGSDAFYGCAKLGEVRIPSKVATIGSSAFAGCSDLTLRGNAIGSNVKSVGNLAFQNCKSLRGVFIQAKVTEIGGSAFAGSGVIKVTFAKRDHAVKLGDTSFPSGKSLNDLYKKQDPKAEGSYDLVENVWQGGTANVWVN